MSKISGDGNLQGVSCVDNDVNNSIDNSIHTIYNTFNRPTTQESQERERSSEMQHLLNWLSEQNFAITQNDIFNQRADGTGIWLLEDPIFLEWFNGKSKVLCCYGIPGAGKSVLASVVINHLEKTFADDKTTAITYIYCNYNEQSQQTMESLIRNLLRQLLIVAVQRGLNKEYNAVLALYKEHKEKSRSLARVECLRILKDAILAFTKVFIIVDAVDEMIERERESFLRKLESFTELKSIFVLVMSRPIPEIKDYFSSSVQLEISAKESDLAAYVDGQLLSRNVLAKQVKKNPTLSKEIKKGIIDKALGMFLLTTFHLEAVATASTLKELRQHLQNLPEGIDDTYNYAIHRIRGSKWEDLARRVLTWIIYALRPLSITELQHALATDEKIIDLEEDSLIFEDRILSVCAGLVILEDKSRIIKLVHYTAQDYFRRNGLQLPGPNPNTIITITCIMYLSQGHTIFERFLSDETQYNFLRYAAQNWSHHAREALDQLQAERPATALTNLEQQIVTFLRQHEVRESSATSRFWARNMEFWAETESSVEWDAPPLLVAIKFGLDKIVRILLQEIRLLNLCNWWRNAVFYAAAGGFEGILEMLVEAGVDLKAVGDTALSGAIKGRNEGIVRLLLDKGVKTEHDRGTEPPLWIAVEKGHEGIVRLLLDKGAKTEYDGERKPPLLIAAENGYGGIVRLLLDGGAKTEYGNMWESPLWIAAKEGHEGIVRLLLDSFAKTNYDDMWKSPLCIAVEEGHEGIVRLLLDRGTKTEYGDMRKSPLWIAAKEGHEGIVRLLLDSGANTEYGGKGEPPLCIAAENGHCGIVQLLLDKGADIGALGKKKSSYSLIYSNSTETSLWIAVMKGHERVVRLLLDKGAKIEHDKNRKSLILVAAAKGYEEILHLLFGTVANANVKHITAICKAAASGDEGALQLLFDQGVDPGAEIWAIHKSAKILTVVEKGHERIVRNNGAHTEVLGEGNNEEDMYNMYDGAPLWAAVVNGHEGIVRLLLDKGAYTEILGKGNNRGNKYEGTPLWVAAMNGHEGMVRLLLDKGADIDVRGEGKYAGNMYEGTTLWVAAMNDHEGIVRLLLDKGADIEALGWGSNGGNMYGGTPLWVAVMNGRERIVRLLLDKGAYTGVLREINDEEGMCIVYKGTPLWIAATEGHEGIVQLLLDLGVHTEALGEGGYDTYSKGTPLWIAAMNGHEGIVRLLLNKGAHTDALGRGYWDDDMYEGTPLLAAAMNGHEGIVRLLLDKGTNIEGLGREDESSGQESEHAEDIIYKATPLWVAAMNGHEGIVQLLLDKGAHTEILRERSGNMYMVYEGTPLWVAATKGHEGIVRLLLNKGAYTEVLGKRNNGEDMHKGTPLWVAAMNGHEGIVQLLLDKGAHTEAIGEARFRKHMFKVTSLWVAAKNGHERVVRFLLDKGANIGAFGVQESIQPPFFQESILRHFFQESIQQSFFTQSGIRQEMIRLISIAIRDKGIVEFLYVKSAHTEGRVGQYLDEDMYKGTTPLCIAAMECREDIVQLMLDRGAVCCGKTLCAAAEVGNLRIVRMLLEGGDITVHGGMALCVAALLGRRRVLHLLLDRGASVNTRVPGRFYFESGFLAMTNSWTPLSCAIFMGHVELIDILLQHGAATDDLNYEQLLLYTRLEYISDAIRQLLSEKLATGEAGNVSNQKRGEVGRGSEAEGMDGCEIEEGKVDHSRQTRRS